MARVIADGGDVAIVRERTGAEYSFVDCLGGVETTVQFDGVEIGEYTVDFWRGGPGGGRVDTGSVERITAEPVIDLLRAIERNIGSSVVIR